MFGASLRKKLMREVRGAAICGVRIDGADHEFKLFDGVIEDVVQIVENLKKVRVVLKGAGPTLVAVSASGPKKLVAGDLARDPDVVMADPSQVIATVGQGGQFNMEVEIASGVGYESIQGLGGRRPGWIEIDRNYSPVRQVAMRLEEEGKATFLWLGITTDGTLGPEEAVVRAASALELKPETREPIGPLCRSVAELGPVQAPAVGAVQAELQTR